MKAERNQDGTYTVQMTEDELLVLQRASFDEAMHLIVKRSSDENMRAYDLETADMLEVMGLEFKRAFDSGWYQGRRLRPYEVPERKAA